MPSDFRHVHLSGIVLKSTETRSSAILQITYMCSSSAYCTQIIWNTNIGLYAGMI